jgi:phosphoglycolate phosphatase-like HAD superfamily hydrolase
MKSFIATTLLSVAALTFAASISERTAKCTPEIDTYNDLQADPTLPLTSAIKTYNDLTYKGWVLAVSTPHTSTPSHLTH